MIAADPARDSRPPYVGPSGWMGVHLDRGVDWVDVKELVADRHQLVAPKPKRAEEPAARRTGRDRPGGAR